MSFAPAQPKNPAREAWWLLGLGVLAVATAAAWALRQLQINDNTGLRALVPTATPFGLDACLLVMSAGLVGLVAQLRLLLDRRTVLTALGLVLAGWILCCLAPRAHRILYDEHIYMQIGQTLAHTGRAEQADYARVEHGKFELYQNSINKQPNGWPYLLGRVYQWTGSSTDIAFAVNRLLAGLAAATLFLALTFAPWRLPAGTPLAAALAYLLTPLIPWWSRTVAVEPSTAATTLLSFAAACLYIRLRQNTPHVRGQLAAGMLLAAATAFAWYFRPESLLAFPLVALVCWSTEDRFYSDPGFWGAALLAAALATPNFLHLWSMRTEDWGAHDGQRFALDFIGKNLGSNLGYFFQNEWFPAIGTLPLAIGAGWLLLRRGSVALVLAGWLAASWGIFVLFYAGGYHYGASCRYAVISAAPVALLIGLGLTVAFHTLKPRPLLAGAAAMLFALGWASGWKFVPTLTREAIEAQEDIVFIQREAVRLPTGSLVVTQIPYVWFLEGRNASHYYPIENMLESQLRELANQYPGGIYLHYGFWENAEPTRARLAADWIVSCEATELARYTSHAHTFGLFRLDTPGGLARHGGPRPATSERKESDLDLAL
ncbi:MAG: hypothetical protein RL376_305, partial [Verrucomicrobiota bacterium]